MRDEYDPATDWTLDVYDPWDREAPPAGVAAGAASGWRRARASAPCWRSP